MPITTNIGEVKTFNFPGGECHVTVVPQEDHPISNAMIYAHITNSNEVMQLLLVTDAIRRLGHQEIDLIMPYVPYARQDRVCNPGEAHSLKVFASLINAQNYSYVGVFDPHSDVTEALFNNIDVVKNHTFVANAIDILGINDFHLVSPDAGAYKKIFYLAQELSKNESLNFDVVNCNKERDTKTGAITNFTVGSNDLGGKPCIIVDDICSRGGTFLGLAKVLRERNCGDLYLVVSHDEGVADKEAFIAAGFKKFVKTDSFSLRNDDFFIVARPF